MLTLTPDNLTNLSGAERRAAMSLARKGVLRIDRSQNLETLLPDWQPQPKQELFLSCPAVECLFGGAAGGGKTDALLNWSIRLCVDHPGIEGLLVRRKMVDMSRPRALISRARTLLAPLGWKWNEQHKRWTSPKGSVIQFGQVENDASAEQNYQGAQPEFLGFEEAGQFTAFQINYLIGRVRTVRPGYSPQIRLTANPGGPGHAFLMNRYVRQARTHGAGVTWQPEREAGNVAAPPTRCFIPATVDDNSALLEADPGYIAKLENLPEPYRSAYRAGDWDAFGGSFFGEWNEAVHLVDEHDLPDRWNRLCALDWGFNHPTCILWAAVSPDGVVYVYREVWVRFAHVSDLAARLREYPDTPSLIAAGPDVFTMQKTVLGGPTIAEEFREHSVFLQNVCGSRPRRHQWVQVRKYLQWQNDAGPLLGQPWLRIMRGCAPRLVEQLPAMSNDPDDVEDMQKVNIDPLSGEGGDDAVDALAYLCMSRPVASDAEDPFSLPRNSLLRRAAEREQKARAARRSSLTR